MKFSVGKDSEVNLSVFAHIQPELDRIRQKIIDSIRSENPLIDSTLEWITGRFGKMIRSSVLIVAGRAYGPITDTLITLASIIEMIHTASLLHDDVIDQADLRRGRQSANARWGNSSAVLLGDYVLSRAFDISLAIEDLSIRKILIQTAQQICEGELMQNLRKADWDLSEEDYFKIIDGKTAALFACSAQLGAMASNASDEQSNNMRQYGLLIGRNFQISDDLLDLVSTESKQGKTLGTDLSGNKPTLPIIHWLSAMDPMQKENIVSMFSSKTPIEWILGKIKTTDSIEYARKKMQEFHAQACESLNSINAASDKQSLIDLSELIYKRV